MQNHDAPGSPFDFSPCPRPPEPDAHGRAALLLTESILHVLVETGVLSHGQAMDAVRTAADLEAEALAEVEEAAGPTTGSSGMLAMMELSLATAGRHESELR